MKHLAVLLGMSAFVASVACGPAKPDYEELANSALDDANLDDVTADYDTGSDVVHVMGIVQTEADRQRAGDIVLQAVNHEAQVANEVTVAGGHTETANDLDGGIETRLGNVVDLDASLKDSDVTFDSNNGVVTVTGRVPTAALKDRVDQIARNEAGVRDVVNSLEVGAAK